MAEYIDRDIAIQFIEEHMTNVAAESNINKVSKEIFLTAMYCTIDYLSFIPAADVEEVVRCKDCKFFTEGMAIGMCKRVKDKPILPMPYNNFCGFAVKKENAE